MCHYTILSTEERELSRVLKAQGLSIRAIARMLNRSPSSVSREFRRNSYSNGTYAAHHADKLYQKRRKNCGRKPKLKAGAARDYVLEKMALRWSPEQIAGRVKRDKESFSISFPTIYRAIDTVLGMRKTGCFGTHVERKSGYLIAFRIDDRQDNVFNTATIKAFSSVPDKLKKSFTVDNGKEFAAHKELTDATGMKVYFCDPYSPWQRGTNENTNGLLRQFFPKGTSFTNISDDDLQHIVDLINNRPRKRLGFRTPLEVLYKFFR